MRSDGKFILEEEELDAVGEAGGRGSGGESGTRVVESDGREGLDDFLERDEKREPEGETRVGAELEGHWEAVESKRSSSSSKLLAQAEKAR